MAHRPQRRLRHRAQTLRARRTGREPEPVRARRHGPIPILHPLRRSERHTGQYGLVQFVRRRRDVSGSGRRGPVCDLQGGRVVGGRGGGVCGGDGGQGWVMTSV